MNTTPKRRWFSVSLRELALVAVAIGLGLAWYLEHQELAPIRAGVRRATDVYRNLHPHSPVDGVVSCEVGGIPVLISIMIQPTPDEVAIETPARK